MAQILGSQIDGTKFTQIRKLMAQSRSEIPPCQRSRCLALLSNYLHWLVSVSRQAILRWCHIRCAEQEMRQFIHRISWLPSVKLVAALRS